MWAIIKKSVLDESEVAAEDPIYEEAKVDVKIEQIYIIPNDGSIHSIYHNYQDVDKDKGYSPGFCIFRFNLIEQTVLDAYLCLSNGGQSNVKKSYVVIDTIFWKE